MPYLWSGDTNYEEIRFSGDGEDFNEWLKIKWYERYRNLDWDDDLLTRVDGLVKYLTPN